jgi:hypothetical protein
MQLVITNPQVHSGGGLADLLGLDLLRQLQAAPPALDDVGALHGWRRRQRSWRWPRAVRRLLLRMLLLRLLLLLLRQCSADCTASGLVASLGARRASLLFLCFCMRVRRHCGFTNLKFRLEPKPTEPHFSFWQPQARCLLGTQPDESVTK